MKRSREIVIRYNLPYRLIVFVCLLDYPKHKSILHVSKLCTRSFHFLTDIMSSRTRGDNRCVPSKSQPLLWKINIWMLGRPPRLDNCNNVNVNAKNKFSNGETELLKLLEHFQIARRLRVFNLKSIYTFDCSWLREIVELHGTFHKIPRSTSNWYFLILHPRFSLNVCFWQYLWKQKTWGGEVKNYQNFHFPFDRRSNECLLLLLFTHSWSLQVFVQKPSE